MQNAWSGFGVTVLAVMALGAMRVAAAHREVPAQLTEGLNVLDEFDRLVRND